MKEERNFKDRARGTERNHLKEERKGDGVRLDYL